MQVFIKRQDGRWEPLDAEVMSITWHIRTPDGRRVAPRDACPLCCTQAIGEPVVCEHGVAIPPIP